jgi:hypothetical protein
MLIIRKFSLFHLSFIPITEPSFETLRDTSRAEWLRLVLSQPFSFPYLKNEDIHWVPQPDVDGLIVGIIEKRQSRLQHLPPEQGGAEVSRPEWQGAYIIIDPEHHIDGQKMAVENDIVGIPNSLVRYLTKHMNSRRDRPFETEPSQIFDSSDYFSFMKMNGSKLEYVKFHFVVPNMWNTSGNLDNELRQTRDETGTEQVDMTFKSRRGLDGTSKRVVEGVEYAARGAGSVRAKSVNGAKYSSRRSVSQTKVEISDDIRGGAEQSAWISDLRNRIFGRE